MQTITPENVTAQLAHAARGNPPTTLPSSAISNCFPGLEFDFRNIWKLLLEGVELREAGWVDGHFVMAVEPGSSAASAGVQAGDRLVQVEGRSLEIPVVFPDGSSSQQTNAAWEFANALAHVVQRGGQAVSCVFRKPDGQQITAQIVVRPLFEGVGLSEDLGEPGALTQGLCSPWQADYRECGCFYWAASRPDFVNVENNNGQADGHDWMQNDRTTGAGYQPDRGGRGSPNHITYDDLYSAWETHLKFILDGRDEN